MSPLALASEAAYAVLGLAALIVVGGIALFLFVRVLANGLLKKELAHFFASPIAWLVMAGFAFVNGFVFLFIAQHFAGTPNQPLPSLLFGTLFFWILQFMTIPAITMRLVAEERATGTLETLMTAPVSDAEVIFAKFSAALVFYGTCWAPTLGHIAIAYWYGVPDGFRKTVLEPGLGHPAALVAGFFRELNHTMDFGPILAGYFGIALMGAAWLAIGVLASTLARNQVVAFVTAFVATIMSFAIGFAESLFPGAPQWAHDGLRYVSFQAAFEPFPRGVVDTRAVVYFLTIAVVALFLSVRVLESRKWR